MVGTDRFWPKYEYISSSRDNGLLPGPRIQNQRAGEYQDQRDPLRQRQSCDERLLVEAVELDPESKKRGSDQVQPDDFARPVRLAKAPKQEYEDRQLGDALV